MTQHIIVLRSQLRFQVELYYSLTLASRRAWEITISRDEMLISFCIEQPFEDMLRLPIGDNGNEGKA